MRKRYLLIVPGVIMLFGSCVSKAKYVRLESQKANYEMENRQLKGMVESLEAKVKELELKTMKIAGE
jgi:cell division protein FtsB